MMIFDHLLPEEQGILNRYLEPVTFEEGERFITRGTPGDGCYWIDEGTVRLEVDIGDIETDGVLGYLEAGSVVGELSLLDDAPRSADAWAHSPLRARHLSSTSFWRLQTEHPRVAVAILNAIARDLALKLRTMNDRLATQISADTVLPSVDAMVRDAQVAQASFEGWPESRVDALLDDLAAAVMQEADAISELAVSETGLGNAHDKRVKLQIGALDVLRSIRERPGAGALRYDEARRILEIAAPVGVVFGLVPLTNPASTFVFKALICLKARNAVILSCHRNALRVGDAVGAIIHRVLEQHGAPTALVQWVRSRASRRKTAAFMAHDGVGLILATGGPGMVKAAYSSGTPAIGVGAGNVPVYLAEDALPARAAALIVQSKSFDHGVICGSESNLIAHAAVADALLASLDEAGAIVLTDAERRDVMDALFPGGTLHRSAIGQSASALLAQAGITRKPDARLVVVPAGPEDAAGPLGHEKPAPILSLFTVADDATGFALCRALLDGQGSGHTAVIHTATEELARRFGQAMPVSRILVNQGSTLGCVGFGNALPPTLTLGCGSWGGGSTTDNASVEHLRNVKRLVFPLA